MPQPGSKALLLGAGASKASKYQLPTMSEVFYKDLFGDFAVQPANDKYPSLRRFLVDCYGQDFHRINLEEIMSHLYDARNSVLQIDNARKRFLDAAYDELDAYIYQQLVENRIEKDQLARLHSNAIADGFYCEQHQSIFESLDLSNGSILSLNYDLIADGTLRAMEREERQGLGHTVAWFLEYSESIIGRAEDEIVGLTETTQGYYLKLHGSLDYVCCPNPSCDQHRAFYVDDGTRGENISRGKARCSLCNRTLVRAIIPPELGKSMQEFPKTAVIWGMAFEKLCHADHWIIWGISFAQSDHHLRTLLREAAQTRRAKRDAGLKVTVIDTPAPQDPQSDEADKTRQRAEEITQTKATLFRGIDEYLRPKTA